MSMSLALREDETWRLIYAMEAWRDLLRDRPGYPDSGSKAFTHLVERHRKVVYEMVALYPGPLIICDFAVEPTICDFGRLGRINAQN